MNTPHNPNQQFDDNLSSLGAHVGTPDTLSDAARARCAAAFHHPHTDASSRTMRFVRRPAFLSTVGVAASLALIFGFLYHPAGNGSVDAAVILAKLDDQIRQSPLIDIVIDSVNIEEVFVNGKLQACESGIAGDIQAKVTEDSDGPPIEVDATFGLSPNGGWVLIRKLVVPDPEIAPILNFFLPPGGTTLVFLPADDMKFNTFGTDHFRNETVTQIITELIESASDIGATIMEQPDGNILLTLPIEDETTVKAISRLKSISGKNTIQVGVGASARQPPKLDIRLCRGEGDEAADETDASNLKGLFGITLKIIYDPHEEIVRSLVIEDIGDSNGHISVTIGEGEMDPNLLDSSTVTDASTRVLDLGALQKMFKSFEKDKGTKDTGE